uniref:Uncharacterized protein n=1 Tax=Brassica oleracea var. oleracea TaxID=109376 RepID=A0A0D3CF16_BRAOL
MVVNMNGYHKSAKEKRIHLGNLCWVQCSSCCRLCEVFLTIVIEYGLVVLCNVVMWGCYVNSLRALSSLHATITNFAANFLSSGFAGFLLFHESLSIPLVFGALSITIAVVILSNSSVDKKISSRTNIIASLLEKVCFCVQVLNALSCLKS